MEVVLWEVGPQPFPATRRPRYNEYDWWALRSGRPQPFDPKDVCLQCRFGEFLRHFFGTIFKICGKILWAYLVFDEILILRYSKMFYFYLVDVQIL